MIQIGKITNSNMRKKRIYKSDVPEAYDAILKRLLFMQSNDYRFLKTRMGWERKIFRLCNGVEWCESYHKSPMIGLVWNLKMTL